MQQLIDEFAGGSEKLRSAIKGLDREDFLAHPVPGTWSIQEIIIHIVDSDLVGVDRMKRIIAENNPLLIGYDETAFAKNLFYADQDIAYAIALFDLNRKQFLRILNKLSEQAWSRTGVHNEAGKVTLKDQLKKYCEHLEHHLKFLLQKKALLGK
jgi:hypothetical protein